MKTNTMTTRATTLAILALSACHFESEGMGDESSSSDTSGDTTFDPSTTTLPGTTSASGTSTSSGTDESSSDSGTFGDDATTTHGESSTGEAVTDYALGFDGSSYARKIEDEFSWSSTDFTVECWIQIQDTDATGIILDTANVEFTDGWVLYLHNDLHTAVFSFFDESHQNNVVMGPTVESIGTGWHHIAATKLGDTVFLHVDGVTVTTQTVSSTLSFDNSTLWSLGGSPDDDPDYRLKGVALDDIRVTGSARYTADFDPPVEYDVESPSIMMLALDEGEGFLLTDEGSGISFGINEPTWIPGNSE